MDDIMDLLHERETTHGAFEDHARIARDLKDTIDYEAGERIGRGQVSLTAEQRESLDMICHKIGRIVAGDADFADHWDDIAGYAKLCSKPSDEDVPTVTELMQRRWEAMWGEVMYGPTTAPTDWWSGYVPSEIPELYPFHDHRTMAEIMETEERQNAAFGEGDETPMPTGDDPGNWVIGKVCCGETPCQLDGRNCPPDHEHPTPKWDTVTKRACMCERGRCKVDNGWTLGLDIYCCQGERG